MPKPKKINPRTRWAIRGYVKKGYSANKIQKKLRAQHLGIRRKVLLAEIRKAKHRKVKAERLKYTPKKYRRMVSGVPHPSRERRKAFSGRQVALYGSAYAPRTREAYSARFEFYGSGKDCQKAIIKAYDGGWVPRKEWAFVKIPAKDFLKHPEIYAEHGKWTHSDVVS